MLLRGLILGSWFEGQLVIDPAMELIHLDSGKLFNVYRLVEYDLLDELLNLMNLNDFRRIREGDIYDLGEIEHDDLVIKLMVMVSTKEGSWDGMLTLKKIAGDLSDDDYLELEILKRLQSIKS